MGHSENGYATTNYTYYLYDFKCRSNVKMRAFSLWASLDTLYPGTSLHAEQTLFFFLPMIGLNLINPLLY